MILFYVFSKQLHTFKRQHINSDVTEYYSFVTAAFECKDLSFNKGCPQYYWAQVTPDGKHVNKRSIGMAYMYTPFYAIAQLTGGTSDDGYSRHTQTVLVLGIWIYVCIGLFFLGKALFHYFSAGVVVLTLFLLLSATNLIWYTNGEPLFTHGVNFMWFSILLYATIRYHLQQKLWIMVVISFSISMLTIIRPNNCMLGLFPVLYGIYNKETFLAKLNLMRQHYGHLLFGFALFLVPIMPQFLYWKYATGHWIYYSYQGERFYWSRPFIFEVLFSYRKGWLLYTPVMILAIAGIFWLRKRAENIFLPVFVIVPLFIYVISCWWAWSYGGCFGMRPMIDIYPLLAFPLAALMSHRRWFMMLPMVVFMIACVWLNIFQATQYSTGILHFDQMNKETYAAIWQKDKYPAQYDLLISYPDYAKEMEGKGSYYQPKELTEGAFSIKFIRAQYLTALDSLQTGAKANQSWVGESESFQFIYNYSEDRFFIRSIQTGLYLTLNNLNNFIYADQKDVLRATSFELVSLGYNKFALIVPNGSFVEVTEANGYVLMASSKKITDNCYMVIRRCFP